MKTTSNSHPTYRSTQYVFPATSPKHSKHRTFYTSLFLESYKLLVVGQCYSVKQKNPAKLLTFEYPNFTLRGKSSTEVADRGGCWTILLFSLFLLIEQPRANLPTGNWSDAFRKSASRSRPSWYPRETVANWISGVCRRCSRRGSLVPILAYCVWFFQSESDFDCFLCEARAQF